MKIVGIEWDAANWPKCGKHGVSQNEIEHVLLSDGIRVKDPNPQEPRFRKAGISTTGRHVFIVYTHRPQGEEMYLRPISARYMHEKEVQTYERFKKTMANTGE